MVIVHSEQPAPTLGRDGFTEANYCKFVNEFKAYVHKRMSLHGGSP